MKKIFQIPTVLIICAVILLSMTVFCVAQTVVTQTAPQYTAGLEKKSVLINSVGEDVDVLRSCLQPTSRFAPID